jgi:transketolase
MALAAKRDDHSYRTVTLLSDGECDEGSTWEAAMFAAHHRLDNLVAIIDYNKIQSLGTVKDILALEPFADKWRAFGWGVQEIDGHDVQQVEEALTRIPFFAARPSCVIAHTVKGKGVSFMEHQVLWHYRAPDPDEFAKAMAELEEAK